MESFSQFYEELYGDRWPDLARALREPPGHVAHAKGLLKPYFLDPASFAVASLLPVGESLRGGDDTVRYDADMAPLYLDLCAAPGGKALIIASSMDSEARLVANERSASRRSRLHRVLADHLPADVASQVTVTGHDARRWGLHERDRYDAVLADVPCSSERHLIRSAGDEMHWNPRRSRRLAGDQTAILAAAIDACRSGGWVLYSTCTMSPFENDRVVERALRKRPVHVVPPEELAARPALTSPVVAELTEYGIAILPDHAAGAGPMYAALLQKG